MTSLPARRAFAAGIGVAALTATLIAGASPAAAKPKPNPSPTARAAPAARAQRLPRPARAADRSSSTLPGYPTTEVRDARDSAAPAASVASEYLATQIRQLEAASERRRTRSPSPPVTSSAPRRCCRPPSTTSRPSRRLTASVSTTPASATTSSTRAPRSCCASERRLPPPRTAAPTRRCPTRVPTSSTSSANAFVDETGETLLPPYAIKTVQGVKVGFIGMTLEGTPERRHAVGCRRAWVRGRGGHGQRLVLACCRSKGVEAIVVLLHEGGAQPDHGATDVDGCNAWTGADHARSCRGCRDGHRRRHHRSHAPAVQLPRVDRDLRASVRHARHAGHQRQFGRPAGHRHRPDARPDDRSRPDRRRRTTCRSRRTVRRTPSMTDADRLLARSSSAPIAERGRGQRPTRPAHQAARPCDHDPDRDAHRLR